MRAVLILLTITISTCCVDAQYLIVGDWVGVTETDQGMRYINMKLKKNNDGRIVGTLYDSNFSYHYYCFSEVVATALDQENHKFLIEGKKVLKTNNTDVRKQILSTVYMNFVSPDTIVIKMVEKGNYSALMKSGNGKGGGSGRGREFRLGRFRAVPKPSPVPVKQPTPITEKPADTQRPRPQKAIDTIPVKKRAPRTAFSIFIQDSDRQDGDIIRVYVNGKVVLDKFFTKKVPTREVIFLDRRENVIGIESLSEGRISPTTVYIQLQQEGSVKASFSLGMKKGETKTYTMINPDFPE